MSLQPAVQIPPITVVNGGVISNITQIGRLSGLASVMFYGPSDLGGVTYTFIVNPDHRVTVAQAPGTNGWVTLVDGVGPIVPPGVNEGRSFAELARVGAFYIRASLDPGANITWNVTGLWS